MKNQFVIGGLQHHEAGRFDEARQLYERALAIDPHNGDALQLLGLIALQNGNPQDAVVLIKQAIRLAPGNAAFHSNLGAALTASDNPREALTAFRRAGKLDPSEPQYQMSIGNSHALCGDHLEAERWLQKLTKKFPNYALGWFNLGNALRDQQRNDDALGCYQRAIALDGSLADAHNNLGSVFHSLGELEAAEEAYRQALAIDPSNVMAHCNLASALIDRGLFTEAEAACRQAINIAPNLATAHGFLGAAIGHQGRLKEALTCYQSAAKLDPNNVLTIAAIGHTLNEIGEPEQAMRYLLEAERRTSGSDSKAVQQLIYSILLAQGRWQEGWSRFMHREARQLFVAKLAPLRLQTEFNDKVTGKTFLLLREQGLGDEIFFLRYAQELANRGASLIYRSNSKIAGILTRVPAITTVITESTPMPTENEILLIGDLPQALGILARSESKLEKKGEATSRKSDKSDEIVIANTNSYLPPPLVLSPLPERVQRISMQLEALGPRPYIGITWRAGTPPALQKGSDWALSKEIDIKQLGGTLARINGTFISVQRNPASGEIDQLATASGKPVHDFCKLNEELEEMLALLALLDDYIGVSNTNMHLRAGLGKSARVLVPRPAEWRWLAEGDRSPWFPNFAIYRQTTSGDWTPAMNQLASDLLVPKANHRLQ